MKLIYFPRSTYSQKVLIALNEKQAPVTLEITNPTDAAQRAEFAKLNPLGKVPLLVLDDGWKIPESSIIIEYLDSRFGGTRLIPEERDQARQTRFHDRLADLYVNDSMTQIYFDSLKPEDKREPARTAAAHARLDTVFAGFDAHLAKRTWIMGDSFTMADCALLPPLQYCQKVHPFERFKHLSAYAARGFERPSFVAVQKDIAPYMTRAA